MNRIDRLFETKKAGILSVYFTAGYPSVDSVEEIILLLEENGVDMIEIGIPYSDPLADGPVIQETSKEAIAGGMTIETLLQQLKDIRKKVNIPLLLMGYLNPVLQYGFERFCKKAAEAGIDGLIIPDLPLREYKAHYEKVVTGNNLKNIFLITPDTSDERISEIDDCSTGFIYMVSSASTTGRTKGFRDKDLEYFRRISSMKLKNPLLAGFGIHNRETLEQVSNYCRGAIIGSAFMRSLKANGIEGGVTEFFKSIQ
jgi:tryptophan synthase alpha chain